MSSVGTADSARSLRRQRWVRAGGLLGILLFTARAAADQTVSVGPGFVFSPSTVTIAVGETVTWDWQDAPHSSTSDAISGPEVWDSGILSTDATFAHAFQTPGDHPYYCVVHSFPGGTMMNGVVRVVAPTATPTVPPGVTPTPGPGEPAPIPALSATARLLLGVGLAAAALLLLVNRKP
jgi:plastocyanin